MCEINFFEEPVFTEKQQEILLNNYINIKDNSNKIIENFQKFSDKNNIHFIPNSEKSDLVLLTTNIIKIYNKLKTETDLYIYESLSDLPNLISNGFFVKSIQILSYDEKFLFYGIKYDKKILLTEDFLNIIETLNFLVVNKIYNTEDKNKSIQTIIKKRENKFNGGNNERGLIQQKIIRYNNID